MRVAVVGAGAVGGVVAWHLAKAGCAPVIVARTATATRLHNEGLTIQSRSATETAAVTATDDPVSAGIQDLVIVGYKAHDWPEGVALLAPLIGPDTVLLPLLNGVPWWYLEGLDARFGDRRLAAVDPDGAIAAAIPMARVLGCVVYVGASRTAPNHIVWNGGKRLIIGEPVDPDGARAAACASFLKAAGIDAEATPDIRAAIWQKLLGNAAFNPLSALTGATPDAIVGDPALRRVTRAVMAECAAVAASLGIADRPDLEARLRIPPAMVGVKTSMLQDMEAGRPLELGAIARAVVELGQRTGTPTPSIECVAALVDHAWRQRWQAGITQVNCCGAT